MTANGRPEALRSDVPRPDARRPDVDHESLGRPVRVLRAGILTSLDELGLSQLRDRGYDVTVVTVDQASPWAPPSAEDVRIGDLRAVPLRPRSFDIVHCALLLDRIQHVELVLDRFVGALRPGGYLRS